MPNTDPEKSLSNASDSHGNSLSLGHETLFDLNLEGLPEETQIELRTRHAEGVIELQKRAIESRIDGNAVEQRLRDITDNVAKATADQSAATVTGTYNDRMGRTEVIMGNTETAQKGKLSRSQRGESNNTLLYVGIAVGAIIILAIILGN